MENLYDNQQDSKIQFTYTFTEPFLGKQTKMMHLIKRQGIALKVKHGKPTQLRCQNLRATGTECCWWHVKNYMRLEVKQTEQHNILSHIMNTNHLLLMVLQTRSLGKIVQIATHGDNFDIHLVKRDGISSWG